MNSDIDMESYGRISDPVAVDQVDTNSYAPQDEVTVHEEFLSASETPTDSEQPLQTPENPQAGHFRALREEVDRIKAERDLEKREYQLQIDMLRANMAQQMPTTPAPKEREMFEGMAADDVPSVAEIRNEWGQRESAYKARLEELQVQQSRPDYAEVIEKYALPLVQQKPHLLQGIQNAENKALMAYELGKMAQQIAQASAPPQRSESAQKIVDNARKPGTLSQAGGQGALSKADYFATMSDAEFMRMASKNLEGI